MKPNQLTLYTFRRCPYAMRARMALYHANIHYDRIEVDLKNKPQALLQLSPKGQVPVLHLTDGTVIDESYDIMCWALKKNQPNMLPQTPKQWQTCLAYKKQN